MKKVSTLLFLFLLSAFVSTFAQTTPPADYFAGKWEILITGTPNGDAKMVANLVRKDGKLTGQLTNAADGEKIALTDVREDGGNLGLAFTAQGHDVTLDLTKVDDDNLKGSLLNMFDAKAKRIKE